MRPAALGAGLMVLALVWVGASEDYRMRYAVAAALIAAVSGCATAPGVAPARPATQQVVLDAEDEAILKTVDMFLLAIGNHDAVMLDELVIVEGVSWFQRAESGELKPVEPFMNSGMIEPDEDADPFIERYWNPVVHKRGGLAQVWAPYELRDDGVQVHCGIDAVDLVYLDGAWRIASILSSLEVGSCEALGAGTATGVRPRDGWKETPNQ